MKWLAVLLSLIAILLLSGVALTTIALYRRREDATTTVVKVYDSLLNDQTTVSVGRSLSNPEFGDIGTFGGHDWPDSKTSGVGGSLQMNNPTNLGELSYSAYISQLKEGRPSIVGLT
jgi:hypothetical protein